MNKNRPEIKELRNAIEISVERQIKTPSDFDFLSGAIFAKMHQNISPTTLKRLWGYIDGADNTRDSTLTMLAKFIGYKHWDDFVEKLNENGVNTSAEVTADCVRSCDLSENQTLEIGWQPNRRLLLSYTGENQFKVMEAENSKIKAGDTFTCSIFMLGEPLYIDNLVQGSHAPVKFVVGNKTGLTLLNLLP